jgi:DNA primase large subunit
MVSPVGYLVTRLIRQRSYAGGELLRTEKKLEQATATLRAARAAHRAAKKEMQVILKRVEDLDREITERSAVDISDIYARRATPKRRTRRWGKHLAEIAELFEKTEDGILSTAEIVDHMALLYDLPQITTAERRTARRWITSKLQYLVRRGAVERLHDPSDNLLGRWVWIRECPTG